MNRRLVLVLALALGASGCFDSLVGGRCAPGWVADGDHCRPVDDTSPDAGDDADVDAPVCTTGTTWCGACVDLGDDPDHCGACGRSCASGICAASACVGTVAGHVVLIGHDYRVHNGASARLLGNAAALGGELAVSVASIADASAPDEVAAVQRALTAGLTANGRTWVAADPGSLADGSDGPVDVVLVLPRVATAADSYLAGQLAAAALDRFVSTGGVVVGLEGPGNTTAEYLRGAGLVDATAAGAVTGTLVDIVRPADALVAGVPSPYMAAQGSITFTTAADATVIATSGGRALALHVTR